MFNFFSDQSLVDGFNERIEYLVEERVTKIPMKFQVIIRTPNCNIYFYLCEACE